jgi:hypothetical protein
MTITNSVAVLLRLALRAVAMHCMVDLPQYAELSKIDARRGGAAGWF